MSKANIRVCRYKNCSHESREIDIKNEPFLADGTKYYHPDCFELEKRAKELAEEQARKKKEKLNEKKQRDKKTREDLVYIRKLWSENIDKFVVYSQLTKMLNDLLDLGISSDYLVFTIEYAIKHNMNLKHPPGIKYFVKRDEIQNAYKRRLMEERKRKRVEDIAKANNDNSPKFSIKQKPRGFGSIFGGDK